MAEHSQSAGPWSGNNISRMTVNQHRIAIVTRVIHFGQGENIERLAWRAKRWNTAVLKSASRKNNLIRVNVSALQRLTF
jgi:hypothetical protein